MRNFLHLLLFTAPLLKALNVEPLLRIEISQLL